MEDENNAERTLHITRTLNAPVELVWEVWTDAVQIEKWWGPNGFTSTTHKMDFEQGGEWKLTLHGPDGTNYPNRSIFMEIIPFEKISFEHFNPHFFTTVLFQSKGGATLLDWSMLFDNAEIFETVVKAHKADEGLRQNVNRLEDYLAGFVKEEKPV